VYLHYQHANRKPHMPTITIATVRQAAADSGMTDLQAITAMQVGAAKIGDSATLEALCAIKSELLGL
jgi:hypothetical protein